MRVLGLDPSLRGTGAALVVDGKVTSLRIPTKPAQGLDEQVEQIRYIVGRVLKTAGPVVDLTVIEAPYVPRHGAGDLIERAWLFGMLVDQLARRGPVARVRTRTRAMYATSNGNAAKAAVLDAVRTAYPHLTVRSDDEADAITLAAMGARHLGDPVDGTPTSKQLDAMAAVRWPDLRGTK